ncbi:MAG: NAD(P)-dependent oxidoreductase [Saprospiraceae bacterium]
MRILITDDVHPILIDGFRSRNYIVDFEPNISLNEVLERVSNYQGLVINSKIIVDKNLIQKASKLRCVARLGSGKEILDLAELNVRNIKVITTPEANCNAVAEQALGMLLSLVRHIPRADQEVKQLLWKREENRGSEISNLCFGVIGFGHTGTRFCELLSGFGARVLVYDKYKNIDTKISRLEAVRNIEELYDCDVISLHVSLLAENRHLIDQAFIQNMKRPFYLINTSRGLVVDTYALVDGLQSGKIKGACLDVFENEKPPSFNAEETLLYHKLYEFPNTILSPHIAGWTHESKLQIAQSILNQWP